MPLSLPAGEPGRSPGPGHQWHRAETGGLCFQVQPEHPAGQGQDQLHHYRYGSVFCSPATAQGPVQILASSILSHFLWGSFLLPFFLPKYILLGLDILKNFDYPHRWYDKDSCSSVIRFKYTFTSEQPDLIPNEYKGERRLADISTIISLTCLPIFPCIRQL